MRQARTASATVLIRGAQAIMTGLPGKQMRSPARDIRVQGTLIREMGSLAPGANEQVIDARDCVIYPAWVNTHHHLLQGLLKGVPGGMNCGLTSWLQAVPFRYRMRFTGELLETAALLGLSELMLGGCATVADLHNLYYPGIGFDGAEILFRAASQLGMRLVLCRAVATRQRTMPDGSLDPMPLEHLHDALADVHRIAKTFHDGSARARQRIVVATPMLTQSLDPGELRELAAEARRLRLHLHSHLAETPFDLQYCRDAHDAYPLEFARSVGWTGPDSWYAHLTHITEEDIRILAQTRTAVAHCPGSNCRLGSGIADIPAMAAAGVRIGLGQDGGAASEPGHMLAEAHLAWYLHRSRAGASAVPIEDVIHWGTHAGAGILGLDALGALAPELEADLAVYQLDELCFAAHHDLAIAPLATGIRPKLKCLMIGGNVVVEDGRILGVDMAALLARAREAVGRLARNA